MIFNNKNSSLGGKRATILKNNEGKMIQTLNGIWNYRIGKGDWSKKEVPFSALCVGHSECQRYFDLEYSDEVLLLKFEGITYNATVYLNGKYLGKMLPYSEYTFDITDIATKSDNCLLVEIEDINASFGPSEGWENYGGIIRNVLLVYKKKSFINDVFFTQKLINSYTDAEYTVNVSSFPSECRITLSLGDTVVDTYIAKERQTRVIKNVKLWSPESPSLYSLKVELLENGCTVDTYQTRVGFREFRCNKNHFVLNGQDIFLKGVCKHEMYGKDSGHTVSYKDVYNDLKMIKDSGCNFVRLVHYPHNKATLDITDELGLLCCEEPGMWQADVTDNKLTSECLEVLRRTVLRDRNHPSVVFWLAFNECDFEEGFLKNAVQTCRENDGTRMVSGANNMSNDDTKKYYNLCGLDFYTTHPYSNTFDMAEKASRELWDKPLMFTEWGGYYVYDNPHLLNDFLTSMYELYKKNALAGTCLWYWAEINDYNRGGVACVDGVLKEALVDVNRKPTLIYDAFCKALKRMDEIELPYSSYEAHVFDDFKKTPLKCTTQPSYDALMAVADKPLKTKLAKTRKKQIKVGPVLQNEEIDGISKTPFLVTATPLIFKGVGSADSIFVLGMTSLSFGYPILGDYGEDVAEILIRYEDGTKQEYIAKNGIDITTIYTSIGSSRVNPASQNAKRLLSFSYDKNFEEYIINHIEIKTKGEAISQIEIKSLNSSYDVVIYGVYVSKPCRPSF